MTKTRQRRSLFGLLGLLLINWVACSVEVIASSNDPNDESGWEEDWSDDWNNESEPAWQLSAFTEAAFGRFINNNLVKGDSSLSELRASFDVKYSHDFFELNAKLDILNDRVLKKTQWLNRELNLVVSPFTNLDVKIGRQILTWGTGDYLFLNDMFAKDWQAFFSGRDDEYLKSSSDSARFSWYVSDFTFELVWTPNFTPDMYLTGERFSFYSPSAQKLVAPAEGFSVVANSHEQWSVRIATAKKGVEYALYAYHGLWTTPQGLDQLGRAFFSALSTWGGSVRMPLGKGLFNLESVYYQSREDRKGVDSTIANDQFRFLLGYEKELLKDVTLGLQYYLEKTLDYSALVKNSELISELVDENRQLLTLRLRYTAMQQKLTYAIFAFYSPTDSDSYIRPSISYRANDNWFYSLGANFFAGKHQYSFFGQHEDNSNVWLRGRYQF